MEHAEKNQIFNLERAISILQIHTKLRDGRLIRTKRNWQFRATLCTASEHKKHIQLRKCLDAQKHRLLWTKYMPIPIHGTKGPHPHVHALGT